MGLSGVRIAKLIFPGNARGERERETFPIFLDPIFSPSTAAAHRWKYPRAEPASFSVAAGRGEGAVRPCWCRLRPMAPGDILSVPATSPQFRRHPFVGEGCIPAGCPDLRGGRGGGGGVGDIPGGVCYILSMSVTSPTPPLHRPRTVTAKTVDFVQGSMVAGG